MVALANPGIARVRECTPHKFASGIVHVGRHADRVRRNIEAMADDYASSMPALTSHVRPYEEAAQLVLDVVGPAFVRQPP